MLYGTAGTERERLAVNSGGKVAMYSTYSLGFPVSVVYCYAHFAIRQNMTELKRTNEKEQFIAMLVPSH